MNIVADTVDLLADTVAFLCLSILQLLHYVQLVFEPNDNGFLSVNLHFKVMLESCHRFIEYSVAPLQFINLSLHRDEVRVAEFIGLHLKAVRTGNPISDIDTYGHDV